MWGNEKWGMNGGGVKRERGRIWRRKERWWKKTHRVNSFWAQARKKPEAWWNKEKKMRINVCKQTIDIIFAYERL